MSEQIQVRPASERGPDATNEVEIPPAKSAEAKAKMRRRNLTVAAVLVFFCVVAFAWMLIRFGLR